MKQNPYIATASQLETIILSNWIALYIRSAPCMDPESFIRGGPTLTTIYLVDEGRPLRADYHGPPRDMPFKGVLLAGRLWPNLKCWLGSFVIFQGTRTCIA